MSNCYENPEALNISDFIQNHAKIRNRAVDIDLYRTKHDASISNVFKTSLPSSGLFYIGRNVNAAVDVT